jgi:hypothetical protein
MQSNKKFDPYFLVKAYTAAYALCYLAATLIGLHDPHLGIIFSRILLFTVGIGLLMSLYTEKTSFIIFMAAVEALGCVAHFFKVINWIPSLDTNGYLLMSMLDFSQSVFLLLLIEYKNQAKTDKIEDITIKNM